MAKVCEFCEHAHDHPDMGADARVCKRYPPTWQFLVIDTPAQTGIVGVMPQGPGTTIQRKSAQPSVRSSDTCSEFVEIKPNKKKMS